MREKRWSAVVRAQDFAIGVGKTVLGCRLAPLGPVGLCALAHSIREVERSRVVRPFVSAETLKTCARNGLHLLAADSGAGSSGSQSLDLGDMSRQGCFCSASDTSLGCDHYEHNSACRAIEVIGQNWSSEVVALCLEEWELRRVALSCHLAMDLLRQETRMRCLLRWLRVAGFSSLTVFAVSGKLFCGRRRRNLLGRVALICPGHLCQELHEAW